MLISLESAQDKCLQLADVVGQQWRQRVVPEIVSLGKAVGRVLAQDVFCDRDQPPFDRATRDGFALRAGDLPGDLAVDASGVLSIVGEVAAGSTGLVTVPLGACVAIMTGGPVPPGADAVVMIENTEAVDPETGQALDPSAEPLWRGQTAIRVTQRVVAGDNIVPVGSEAKGGDLTLAAGTKLQPRHIAALASVGAVNVRVWPRVRVAVVTTGDEIVVAGQIPGPTQIRDSNLEMLCAWINQQGAQAVQTPLVIDNKETLVDAVGRALASSDVVVATGGVSKGKYDFVKDALDALGATTVFAGVKIRPGKPVLLAHLPRNEGDGADFVPFFGLPGNPVSAAVTAEILVRPFLTRVSGATGPVNRRDGVVLQRAWHQRALAFDAFVPVRRVDDGDGFCGVQPLVSQGSGDLICHAQADGLMKVPAGIEGFAAGARVGVLWL